MIRDNDRLKKQMAFIAEIDRLKQVFRQSLISDGSRRENDAEHSWHTALMCVLLSEYAPEGVDVSKSARLMLIHDLVEIYAGDTYFYDDAANETKLARERQAAEKLFALLPEDQCELFKSLWEEFEAKNTEEAKFAGVMDRIQPIMLNYLTKGERWKYHGVTKDVVLERTKNSLKYAHPDIRDYIIELIEDGGRKGYFSDSTEVKR